MDVILLKRVDNLGEAGDVISVARGYARNYLIPQGIAVVADDSHRRALVEEDRLSGLRSRKMKRVAEEIASSFQEVSCTIPVQAAEDEKLYGSVGERDIADALRALGHEIEHRQIVLEEPIKQLGVYTVPVKLHEEVEVTVKVWVVRTDA